MGKISILKEFFLFLKARRKWWLFFCFGVLFLIGLILILGQNSFIAPFVYTLF